MSYNTPKQFSLYVDGHYSLESNSLYWIKKKAHEYKKLVPFSTIEIFNIYFIPVITL